MYEGSSTPRGFEGMCVMYRFHGVHTNVGFTEYKIFKNVTVFLREW